MNDGPNAPNPINPQDAVVAQVIITMNATGGVMVNGPIENRLLMYGLLAVAMDLVRDHGKTNERRVVPAPAGLAGLLTQKGS